MTYHMINQTQAEAFDSIFGPMQRGISVHCALVGNERLAGIGVMLDFEDGSSSELRQMTPSEGTQAALTLQERVSETTIFAALYHFVEHNARSSHDGDPAEITDSMIHDAWRDMRDKIYSYMPVMTNWTHKEMDLADGAAAAAAPDAQTEGDE
jgi:hypothetical protein